MAVSKVDRLIDPDSYDSTVSYTVGAVSGGFGSADGKDGVFYVSIKDPEDGSVAVKEVLVTL